MALWPIDIDEAHLSPLPYPGALGVGRAVFADALGEATGRAARADRRAAADAVDATERAAIDGFMANRY
jgi:hypothetical protein